MIYVKPELQKSYETYSHTIILHYFCSCLLHLIDWSSKRNLSIMRHIDHSVIYILMLVTYTSISDAINHSYHPLVIFAFLVGLTTVFLSKCFLINPSNKIIAGPYLLTSLVLLTDIRFFQVMVNNHVKECLLFVIGGLSAATGAIIYIRKSPNPLPHYFGYHELFHVFGSLATCCTTKCLFDLMS